MECGEEMGRTYIPSALKGVGCQPLKFRDLLGALCLARWPTVQLSEVALGGAHPLPQIFDELHLRFSTLNPLILLGYFSKHLELTHSSIIEGINSNSY